MKRRNFTEKSNTVRSKFATKMVEKTLAKMEKAMKNSTIAALKQQWYYGADDCVAYDEDGNELNNGDFDQKIAEEIAEEILYDGFYDEHCKFIELPSKIEMIKELLNDCERGQYVDIKREPWSDTFERMICEFDTGIKWFMN